ncbi:porin [uncultured Corynebacterium sp.]|uniref:porin n=1 Tax=uncultured Corynebacterium sp. TaxID=159447 RepID=UPI0025F148A6|nr:porin [uncultured Corynebacterium sp.]
MKISTRIAAIGASAFLAMSAFSAPASAFDFASLSSTNKELSNTFDGIPCGLLEFGLGTMDLPEDGMHNGDLADALAERGEGAITAQFPQVSDWNAKTAADIADRAQKCGLVKEDTYLSELSSGSS